VDCCQQVERAEFLWIAPIVLRSLQKRVAQRMSSHDYGSKFHRKEFCDPDSIDTRDHWLWVGKVSDGSVTGPPLRWLDW